MKEVLELQKTTKNVITLLQRRYNKMEFSELLGMSRPTLDTRLDLGNWKKTEVAFIKSLVK